MGSLRPAPPLPLIAAERRDSDLRATAVANLARINLDDLIESFGWRDRPLLRGVARRLLSPPALAFARQILEFDTAVGRNGLIDAARHALANYAKDSRIIGREHIPRGPFLALSNHPGMTDALALFGALDRPDLLVVAAERPFLQALPRMSQHLSCLSQTQPSQVAVLRRVGRHLRAGGAALSFPAGHIEPDPLVHAGAAASLESWTQSAGPLVRLAPETVILPVLVRGVAWPRTLHRLLARLGPTREREKAAAAAQLLAHVMLNVRSIGPTVQIGRPIDPRNPARTNAAAIHQAVVAAMREMIAGPIEGREVDRGPEETAPPLPPRAT